MNIVWSPEAIEDLVSLRAGEQPGPVPAVPVGRRRCPARNAAECMAARRVPARRSRTKMP